MRIRKLLAQGAVVLLASGMGVWIAPSAASAATTQGGCTFSVPKPTFNSSTRTAGFSVKFSCPKAYNGYNQYDRQLLVDLMENDGVRSQFITYRLRKAKSAGTYYVSASGIRCNYDAVGNEELYLRARVETMSAVAAGAGTGWTKGKNIGGAQISVSCK